MLPHIFPLTDGVAIPQGFTTTGFFTKQESEKLLAPGNAFTRKKILLLVVLIKKSKKNNCEWKCRALGSDQEELGQSTEGSNTGI